MAGIRAHWNHLASHALRASRVVTTVVASFGHGDAGEGIYRRELLPPDRRLLYIKI